MANLYNLPERSDPWREPPRFPDPLTISDLEKPVRLPFGEWEYETADIAELIGEYVLPIGPACWTDFPVLPGKAIDGRDNYAYVSGKDLASVYEMCEKRWKKNWRWHYVSPEYVMYLSPLVEQARELARSLPWEPRRMSGLSFFDAHLEPVARLVALSGGSKEAIALAYLHDVLEDIGQHMRGVIEAISPEMLASADMLTEIGSSWEEKKAFYKANVARVNSDEWMVSICDKICTGNDFITEWGEGKFGKRPAEMLQFYKDMQQAYNAHVYGIGPASDYLRRRLNAIIGQMEDLYVRQ